MSEPNLVPADGQLAMPLRFAQIMQTLVEQHTSEELAPDGSTVTHRTTLIPVNGSVSNAEELVRLVEDFRHALAEFTPVLLDGFGVPNLRPLEPHTSGAQQWLVERMGRLWAGCHPWSKYLPRYPSVAKLWESSLAISGTARFVVTARYGLVLFAQEGETPQVVPAALVSLNHSDPNGKMIQVVYQNYQLSSGE